MKVGILTFPHSPSLGAMLQMGALYRTVEEMGHDVEIINYVSEKVNHKQVQEKTLKAVLIKILSALFIKSPAQSYCEFESKLKMFPTKTISSENDMEKAAKHFDRIIVGSDQVWNPLFNNGRDPSYFLQFGSLETKRVAYAASFGVSTLEEQDVKRMKEWLKSFSAISVRETTGLRLLTSIGILGAQHVVDPVFLLSPKDWNILIQDGTSPALDYVLVYNLGQVDESIKSCAQELARKHNLSILSIEDSTKIKYADKIVESAGPIEFVRYIKAARYVVTNSFHATAFSLKFNVPFYVFIRNVTSSRISDVLSLVALQERLNVASFEMEIDWEKVNLKMENCIKSSKKFIDDILCL